MSYAFETARLRIRPWAGAERPALARMAGDEEMMRHVSQGRAWSDDRIDQFLQRQAGYLERYGVCFGAVELLDGGEIIGMSGMQPHDDGRFELGWWIWKDHWGQGYAAEATRPFIDHAREIMGLDCLVAIIDPPNRASHRVAEKLGMRYECTKSARETMAIRDDVPVAYYRLNL